MDRYPTDKEFTAITASIFYLEQEAGRAGLTSLQSVLHKTLLEIDKLVVQNVDPKVPTYSRILDSNLYKILTILNTMSDIRRLDLHTLLLAISSSLPDRTEH